MRDRSRSPRRRSRSRSQRRSRRSYSRERSRSRGADEYRRSDRDRDRGDRDRDRRSRSPMSGAQNPSAGYPGSNFSGGRGGGPRSFEDRSVAKEQMMQSVRESSQQDRRVYVGNLAYDVKWHHLKDFMRQAGEVLFADVLLLPNGMSKGCGIVEYATRDQAQQAIATLSNQSLMGRLVYVREDRETEPRFVGPPSRGDFGGGGGMRGGFHGGAPGGYGNQMGGAPQGGDGRQLYISNLPFNVGWQDLKDLFRSAAQEGSVIRADVHVDATGRPKGTGIVAFESSNDAQSAIQQFNNYDWQGRRLEVRLDRYANTGGGYQGGPGAFGGGFGGRGGYQGGYGGGRGGFGGGRGGFRGGFGGGPGYGGRGGFAGGSAYGGSNAGGYSGGSQEPAAPNAFTDFATSGGERSGVIFVRNLPWSTSNDDLVELFTTIGKVERAEIKYEGNGRSSGTGVVEFDSADNAETAITKFTGYVYGGRPLGLSYVKYTNQNGGDSMDADGSMTQDQMM